MITHNLRPEPSVSFTLFSYHGGNRTRTDDRVTIVLRPRMGKVAAMKLLYQLSYAPMYGSGKFMCWMFIVRG